MSSTQRLYSVWPSPLPGAQRIRNRPGDSTDFGAGPSRLLVVSRAKWLLRRFFASVKLLTVNSTGNLVPVDLASNCNPSGALLCGAALFLAVCQASAQNQLLGEISYDNRSPSLAPVLDTDCVTPINGPEYLGQLYVGLTKEDLQPFGRLISFNPRGIMRSPVSGKVPGATVNFMTVYAQLRVWAATGGDTYESAVSAGVKYGASSITPVVARFPLAPPGNAEGLESFCLVPEPGTYALGAMGGALLAASSYKSRKGARTS